MRNKSNNLCRWGLRLKRFDVESSYEEKCRKSVSFLLLFERLFFFSFSAKMVILSNETFHTLKKPREILLQRSTSNYAKFNLKPTTAIQACNMSTSFGSKFRHILKYRRYTRVTFIVKVHFSAMLLNNSVAFERALKSYRR